MDIIQLEIFIAVADTGSITAAARRIHRVPSNLTTRIRQLEQTLGTELFIRERQRLRLSPAGHDFLAYSRRVIALLDEAQQTLKGDVLAGRLRLGALESTATVRLPPLLATFTQRYPQVQLDLTTGASGKMVAGVVNGGLAGAFVDGPLTHPALEGTPVFSEEMMVVAPSRLGQIERASQLNGLPLYTYRDNCTYRHHFEAWCAADHALLGRYHELESHASILACVAAGAGVAQLPRSMLAHLPEGAEINAWPLSEPWRWLTTWLVWRRDAATRQLKALQQLLPAFTTTPTPSTR